MAKDPVCGMEVDEEKADKMEYKGKTYYFCCATCRWSFEKNPDSSRRRVDNKWQECLC